MSFLKIRADEQDLLRWKERAAATGMDFSKWVRSVLNETEVVVFVPNRDEEKTPATTVETTKSKRQKISKLALSLPNTTVGAADTYNPAVTEKVLKEMCVHGAPLNQCKVWGCWFYEHSNGRGAERRNVAPDTPMATREPGSKCTYGALGDKKCPSCGKVHSNV